MTTIGRAFGSVLSGAQSISEAFSGVLGKLAVNGKDAASAALSAAQGVLQLGAQLALYSVIAGAVTYAVGALGAAFAGLPALIGAAVVSFAAFKLGMEGIKRAYESSLKPAIDALKTPGMESLLDAIRPTEGVMRTLGTAFGNAPPARRAT